jgi:site-specific recombinase XerD
MARTRVPRQKSAAHFIPFVTSFERSLRAIGRSTTTIHTYTYDTLWLGGWLTEERPDITDWEQVGAVELQDFFIWLRERGSSKSYANQVGRSVQAFFKWYAAEEDVPNPFSKIKPPSPPKPEEIAQPVMPQEDLVKLIKHAEKGKDFTSRRDAAILRLFACTGCRLSEVARLKLDDVNLTSREVTVVGKAGKIRTVKIDHGCVQALDRYIRSPRARHQAAHRPELWLGVRGTSPLTRWGLIEVIKRRARAVGIKLHPHMFRHRFADKWLAEGGAEGDLMELAGWDSPQMLARYGRSARSARARRAYDRVDVMGGL